MGDNIPCKAMKRKVTETFFATFPVFSLEEAKRELNPPGGRTGTVERLKYHLGTGRLKRVTRGIYAVVPPEAAADQFFPDPFLVAVAVRPGCVFAYHSALDLLGVSHSMWNLCTVFSQVPRQPIWFGDNEIRFLSFPKAIREFKARDIGTVRVERRGKWLTTTGAERTLAEGFRNLHYVGGIEELLVSAGGFPVLELDLLQQILNIYDSLRIWAAAGWFLEKYQRTFSVPEEFLRILEKKRPKSPMYIDRELRGGKLLDRWNLIVPEDVLNLGENYASES